MNKLFYILLVLIISGTVFCGFIYYQKKSYNEFNIQNQKIIIFDFDGTLCDSLNFTVNAYNTVCQKFNTKPINNLSTLRDMPLQKFLELHGVTKWKLPIVKYKIVKNMAQHISDMNSFQDIRTTLLELKKKGYILGILTSNSYENVEFFLKKENLEVFDFIYCGSSLFGKARLLNKIKNKTKPSLIFYVGDENRDIEAAHKANIPSIAVSWGYQSESLLAKYKPFYLIKSMKELLTIMK